MIGEVKIVEDVPAAFAELVVATLRSSSSAPFVLAGSGGSSGAACFAALSRIDLEWSRIEFVFVDERCVGWDLPEANGHAIGEALGPRVTELAGFHRMSCDEGPDAYGALLEGFGHLDLVQLGFGPDGHTASIFPGSKELLAPSSGLVARNVDPTGRNPHERLTMTLNALALASRTVVTVVGGDKREAFGALVAGEALPGALADSPSTIWLVDPAAAPEATGS